MQSNSFSPNLVSNVFLQALNKTTSFWALFRREEDAGDRVSLLLRWIIMTNGPLQIIRHHNQRKPIYSTYSVPRLHRYWCNSSSQKPMSRAPSLAPHCRLQNWVVEKFVNFARIILVISVRAGIHMQVVWPQNAYSWSLDYVASLQSWALHNMPLPIPHKAHIPQF